MKTLTYTRLDDISCIHDETLTGAVIETVVGEHIGLNAVGNHIQILVDLGVLPGISEARGARLIRLTQQIQVLTFRRYDGVEIMYKVHTVDGSRMGRSLIAPMVQRNAVHDPGGDNIKPYSITYEGIELRARDPAELISMIGILQP